MSATPGRPRLVVTGGPLDGREIAFDAGSERRFGTGADCDLQVQAGHIEPMHATIAFDGERLVLNDGGSVAGTYVNGEKVGAGRELFDGDRVCLGPPGFRGSVKMVVSRDTAAEPAAADAPAATLDPADFAAPTTTEPPVDLGLGSDTDDFKLEDAAPADDGEDWTLAAPAAAEPAAPAPPPVVPPLPAATAPEPPPIPEVPAEPAPKPAPKRTATAEDYSDGISIAPATPRAAPAAVAATPAPATPRPAAAKALVHTPRPGTDWKRVVIVNGGIAVAALVGVLVWRSFNHPSPVLSTVSPLKARGGESVTLKGIHLGGDAADWTVHFADVKATPSSVTEDGAVVSVPPQFAKTGPPHVGLSIEGPGGRSNELVLTLVRGPAIDAIAPDVALPGQAVRLRGSNLAGEKVAVTVDGLPAEVTSAAPAELHVVVPAVAKPEGSTVEVRVQVGTELGAPARLVVGRLPLLTELTPARGQGGQRVTLRGRGFEATAAANRVTFQDVPALVVSARPDELVVTVPPLAATADVPIVVSNGAGTSAGRTFFYEAPSAAVYVARFVATPVVEHPDHEHAFVSTALGPVLLLSGPGAAQRAADAADALNALAGRVTQGQVVPLSVRADAEPAVVAPGQAKPLVVATAADAAAFGEAWDGVKPSPATPAAVAAYWAALLQDHVTLFAVHTRPVRLIELTPRAQVFLDLWSQAVRQGHGTDGVPTRLLTPVPDTLRASLRTLALTLPAAKGEGAPALAIAGTWEGTTLENGQQKRIRLRLQAAGRGLSGVLTPLSGTLSVDLPLQELTFRNNELRFRVVAGGARTFAGLFDGRVVSGTITGATGRIGEFRLEHVE